MINPKATLGSYDDGTQVLIFKCPGCVENHKATVAGDGVKWEWNGSLELPTISPSLLVQGVQWSAEEHPEFHRAAHPSVPAGGAVVCHSFVNDGYIQYLDDCTHMLKGQTVEIPDWAP